MKRTALISLFAIASIGFASQASAVAVFFDAPSKTTVAIGETFTINYRLDTQGTTTVTSVFVSAYADPAVLTYVGGTSPGTILFNFSTYAGLARASQPVTGVPGDPVGRIRAANFVTSNPTGTGVANANQLMSTLTFMGAANGQTAIIAQAIVGDDEVTVSQVSITASVGLSDSATITVPEPSAAALTLAAIGTIAMIRRRTAA
jgi:hypothetical protein